MRFGTPSGRNVVLPDVMGEAPGASTQAKEKSALAQPGPGPSQGTCEKNGLADNDDDDDDDDADDDDERGAYGTCVPRKAQYARQAPSKMSALSA